MNEKQLESKSGGTWTKGIEGCGKRCLLCNTKAGEDWFDVDGDTGEEKQR